jgi:hypothetical protein
MRNSLIIFIYLFTHLVGYSQDPKDTISLSVNKLYRGIDNPVEVSYSSFADKIVVECSCEEFSGDSGHYIIRPKSEKEIIITVKQVKNGKIVGTKNFNLDILFVPIPKVTLCGKESGETVSRGCFVSQYNDCGGSSPVLIPTMKDFDFAVYAIIDGFDIKYLKDGKMLEYMGNRGNVIPGNIGKEIKDLPKGSSVFFDNIKIQVPGGDIRIASAIFIIE